MPLPNGAPTIEEMHAMWAADLTGAEREAYDRLAPGTRVRLVRVHRAHNPHLRALLGREGEVTARWAFPDGRTYLLVAFDWEGSRRGAASQAEFELRPQYLDPLEPQGAPR
jgi:hypothetical protein